MEELLGELGRTGREGRRLSFDVLEEFENAAGGDRIDLMPQLLHQKESVRLSAIFSAFLPLKEDLRACSQQRRDASKSKPSSSTLYLSRSDVPAQLKSCSASSYIVR